MFARAFMSGTFTVPRFVYWLVPLCVAVLRPLGWLSRHRLRLFAASLAILVTLFGVGAFAAVTTIPPSSRAHALCNALGTEAPCVTEEIGHVRGTLGLVVYDPESPDPAMLRTWGLLTVKRRTYAAPVASGSDELASYLVATSPMTDWIGLVPAEATWGTLRALAKVTEGVPVLVAAAPAKGGVDASSDPGMATTAMLRVRIALVRLAP